MPRESPGELSARLDAAIPKSSQLRNDNGGLIACEHNARLVIATDERFASLRWDAFHREIRIDDRAWTDADDRQTLIELQAAHKVPRFTLGMVRTAIEVLAHERQSDALTHFIKNLPEWDQTPRIELAFHEAFGSLDTPTVRAASGNMLISLVARALRPGAKVDYLWVFEGPQGILKSTALEKLGGEFYREMTEPIASANCIREIRSAWLVQLAELRPLVGRDQETAKAFITRCEDPLIEKYERRVSIYPRRCVFTGTTNEHRYWDDPSGARRLVPIRCGIAGAIRPDLIEANRLQWFAEARTRYERGESWWEFPAAIEAERDDRQHVDPWEPLIETALVGQRETTVDKLLTDALDVPKDRREPRQEKRIQSILRRLKWTSAPRRREGGVLIRPWTKADT
jgi:putative DNA primase/helicase